MTAQLLPFRLVLASAFFWSLAGAEEPPDFIVPEAVPLPEDELRQITVSLLEHYPQLAGSPGAKSASAYLSTQGRADLATVIYYPHTERRGMKVAFQAHCRRPYESKTWACDEVVTRGYLQLASQQFEVRVLASISADAALAVVEAARRDRQATDAGSDTVVMISEHPDIDGYFVGWGNSQGMLSDPTVTMLARLKAGGRPANPDDWHASIFESPALK
jgi:hypothetical protein